MLKGQGVPVKSGAAGILIAAIMAAVPVIVTLAIFGACVRTKINVSVAKQQIVNYEKMIARLSDAVELQKAFEEEKGYITNYISDIKSSVGRYAQRSGVLATLINNIPNSMILTKLEIKKDFLKIKVPKKDDPGKMIDINVPVSTLHISLSGHPESNNEKNVRSFRDALRFSPVMKEAGLDDIRIAQKIGELDGKDVVAHEIYCVFKPKLL